MDPIKRFNRFKDNSLAYKINLWTSYLILGIFGLLPFTKIYGIHRLYILIWCAGIAGMCYGAISQRMIQNEKGLNALISTLLFTAHVMGHVVVLLDSMIFFKNRKPLYEKYLFIYKNLQENLGLSLNGLNRKVVIFTSLFLILLLLGHGLVIWTIVKFQTNAGGLYLYSLPSFLALQFKTMEILLTLLRINYYCLKMRNFINKMGERNLKRIFYNPMRFNRVQKGQIIEVHPLRREQEDERHVEILKNLYNELYATIQMLNHTYGWSLLTLTAVYFIDFVCNTYWIFYALLDLGRNYYVLLQNGCFALLAFVLLSLMCWFCEKADYESRYIGCLISKLVKQPLGNKRYNDLVSELSIQTLHQRFIITAKEFFTLNLGLLGSMVAAIVTYLVILIQFMFTEKSNRESKLTTKVLETTTAKALISLDNHTEANVINTSIGDSLLNISSSVVETLISNFTKLDSEMYPEKN